MQFSSLNSYLARYWKLKTVERNYLFKEFFTFYVSIAVNMHWSKIANSLLVVPLFLKTPFQTLLADDKQLGRLKNCSPLLLHISLSLSLSLSLSFFGNMKCVIICSAAKKFFSTHPVRERAVVVADWLTMSAKSIKLAPENIGEETTTSAILVSDKSMGAMTVKIFLL